MKRYYFLILMLFVCTPVFPDYVKTMLGVLTMNDGLSNNTVYRIHKDKKDFMWFGTDLGISKYDGYRFTNFQLSDQPTAIVDMVETPDSLLWLLDMNGGITCFDPQQEKVIPITFDSPQLADERFKELAWVDEERLCALSRTGLKFLRIDHSKRAKEETIVLSVDEKEVGLDKEDWSLMCKGDKGRVFAFSEKHQQIACYNPETESLFQYDISEIFRDIRQLNITKMCVKDDIVWLFNRWHGVICYNFKSKEYREIAIPGMNSADVKDVVSLGKNTYCLATWNGLIKITFKESPVKGEYEIGPLSNIVDNKIENKSASAFYDEEEDLLWVATFGGGILKYMPDNVFFRWIKSAEELEINKTVQDNAGYVWLATVGNGLMRSTTHTVSTDIRFSSWNRSVFTSGKYCLYKDGKGMIWAGDEQGKFYRINPATNEYEKYQLTLKNKEVVKSRIHDFYLDENNNLWIATNRGIACFDLYQGVCSFIDKAEVAQQVHGIEGGVDGELWVSTQNGLVRLLRERNDSVFTCVTGYEAKAGLNPSLVYSIFLCADKSIVASYADKIIFINKEDREKPAKAFSLGKGLPNGQLYCVTEDLMGNIWMGGNSGIMTMKGGTDLIYTYSLGGNNTSVCRLSDGKLLWSTSNGLFYYNPQRIKNSLGDHGLVLSRLIVGNQVVNVGEEINGQVLLPQSLHTLNKLVFTDRNRFFRLYFTDLQYKTVSQKIEYRLLPDQEEWTVLNVKDGVAFGDLSVGEHVLQVKSIAYDGNIGDTKEFVIQVLPHWTVSWWAWVMYSCILCVVGYVVYRILVYRVKLTQKHHKIQEKFKYDLHHAELKMQQDRESMEVKTRFLNLIMSELRTPLFMIINPLREMLDLGELPKPLRRSVEMAYYNSIGLKDLCMQLMATYELDSDREYLQVTKFDLTETVNLVLKKQKESLNVYQIDLAYEKTDSDDTEVWADRNMIEFVVRSLLTNAYRHVMYVGKVWITIAQQTIDGEVHCVLSVCDDGKAKVERTMADFLSWTDSMEDLVDFSRLELGLELLNRIVDLHHGKIVFKSNEEEHTCIDVYLKCGVAHYTNDPHVVFAPNVSQESIDDLTVLPETDLWFADEELPVETGNHSKKKLLIVEDNMALRVYVRAIFSSDYEMIEAVNGQEGIEVAIAQLPDLILCDVMMPVKNGFECCKALKEDIRTCHIPFIFLTARGMEEDIMVGMDAGADDYLQKPISTKLLRAKVDNVIKNRESLKQAYMQKLISPTAVADLQSEPEDEFMRQVIGLIEEHMDEVDFGVISLAKLLNMSQPTLYRKVKQSTDFNIAELIRGVRLKRAAWLLLNEEFPVQEVVERVGYNDSATFRKHFMKLFGMTPSAYIKENKANA